MKKQAICITALAFILLLTVFGCGKGGGEADVTYKIAILPFMEKKTLIAHWTPIAVHLSETTGENFEVVVADSFEEHIDWVNNREVDFATQSPFATSKLLDNSTVIVKHITKREGSGHEDKLRCMFISREENGIPLVADITDIPGRKLAIVSYKASGGYLSPMLRLQEENIDTSECEFIVGETNEGVIRAVYNGEADVGFIRETTFGCIDEELENPDTIVNIGKGAYVPNWSIVAHNNVPDDLKEEVKEALLALKPESEALVAAEKVHIFTDANDSEYSPFSDFGE